jgi:hypothetical protein
MQGHHGMLGRSSDRQVHPYFIKGLEPRTYPENMVYQRVMTTTQPHGSTTGQRGVVLNGNFEGTGLALGRPVRAC